VYKVLRLADGNEYAMKKVKFVGLNDKEKDNALNEVRLLASIHHSHIVTYKQAFIDEDSKTLCLITEYAQKGDLL
jgi:NIMA (never in mitosis gene a)-related kinase